MNKEQEKSFEPFVKKAKEKNVHKVICLWAIGSMLNSNDWKATLEDIMDMLDKSANGDDFATALLKKYPGQPVAEQTK